MPVAARQLVRSASAADVREKERTERDARQQMSTVLQLARQKIVDMQKDASYSRMALQFSETQHFMLRLPLWGDVLREVNEMVGCSCAACRWNGLLSGECGQAGSAAVESVGGADCVLQLRMLKLLARLRVSVHVADKPKMCRGVDAGALREARTDVYLGGASVVLRNSIGTPCFFDEEGMCSGWGEPVRSFHDRRMQEMALLIAEVERMRAQRCRGKCEGNL